MRAFPKCSLVILPYYFQFSENTTFQEAGIAHEKHYGRSPCHE